MANRPQLRQRLFDDQRWASTHGISRMRSMHWTELRERPWRRVSGANDVGAQRAAVAIEAIRVIDLSAQGTPVTCGSLCSFCLGQQWCPHHQHRRYEHSASRGKRYRFTFRFRTSRGSNGTNIHGDEQGGSLTSE